MTDVRLTGSLPGGDANGIGKLVQQLIDHPDQMHPVIAILDCKSTTTDNDTGEVTPTARIRRIEALLPGDGPQAARLMQRAFESRTGKTMLPLNLEDEIRAAFGNVTKIDPETGERQDEP